MGKNRGRKDAPRQPRIRTKPTLREAPPPPPPPVKVAVVTSPQWQDGEASLSHDVQLVKAAVLYADEVELLGLTASMVHSIGLAPGSNSLSFVQLMELAESAKGESFIPAEVRRLLPTMEVMRKSGASVPPEISKMFDDIEQMTAEANELFRTAQAEILKSTGAGELQRALDIGIVRVPDLGVGMESAVAAAGAKERGETRRNSDADVQRWVDEVASRLSDRRTRLLFDEDAGEFVSSMLDEGVISANQVGLRLAGKAAVGAGFVARLPAFTEVPMDELLDVRSDLDAPLTRYRAAVSRFSVDLPHALGKDLDQEVEHLWETNVSPALIELDELLHQHTFVRELARLGGLDVAKYMAYATGMYVGLGAASDIGQVAASIASAAPGVAEASARALLGRNAGSAEARRHELFYLHEVNKRIAKR